MRKQVLSIFFLFSALYVFPQEGDAELTRIIGEFEQTVPTLQLPVLQLEYIPMLEQSQKMDLVKKQKNYFLKLQSDLDNLDPKSLSGMQLLDYEILKFTAELHLQRIGVLEKAALLNEPISEDGVYFLGYGKDYYRLLLKLWTGTKMSPEQIMEFGHREVDKVKARIEEIRGNREMDDFYSYLESEEFMIRDEAVLIEAFDERKKIVLENLPSIFPELSELPEVKISKNTNRRLAHVPGYYNQNTFYYTLFDDPFNSRKLDWLFIHEANPGHHYQINMENSLDLPAYRDMISSPGYREGWAAYVEEIGDLVGLYRSPNDFLGKWEWDLVRSVRIVLDVGINYYGWDKDRALEYWKKHIPNQDQIAMREINRMINWPAQVHTYKVGAHVIMVQKSREMEKQGDSFDLVEFHRSFLEAGSIPLELVPMLYELKQE